MKWNVVFGTMVAAGSLGATAATAQENAAGTGATAGATANEAQTATSDPTRYGTYIGESATVDPDGVPVANPNAMSRFLDRSRGARQCRHRGAAAG